MGINRIDENDQCILTEANIPDNIICVACGGHHTIALTGEFYLELKSNFINVKQCYLWAPSKTK